LGKTEREREKERDLSSRLIRKSVCGFERSQRSERAGDVRESGEIKRDNV
jgi:hypothetical protein